MHRFTLYGLEVESALDLPGAMPGHRHGPADVRISFADLPEELENTPGGHGDGAGGFLLNVRGTGRYWIVSGSEIRVEREAGGQMSHLRLYLMGSALGALLYMRGFLLLHANAVVIADQAVALAGPSGSGKSTLAMAFSKAGHPVLTDDVCAIAPDGQVEPGWRRMRLWDDAMAMFDLDPADHPRSFEGDPDYRKHDVPPVSDLPMAAPMAAILLFDPDEKEAIRPLGPSEAAIGLIANLYRGEYLESLSARDEVVKSCATLAARVPVYRFSRSEGLDGVAGDVERIAALISGT